jgi:thiol-disulfide isomerase/thioredoxin
LLGRAQSNVFTLFERLPNKPVIVYFTTPDCAPCKTVQRPAIQKVTTLLGENVQVVEIDATERPDLAKTWGVMSVPTTFLLDAHGEARLAALVPPPVLDYIRAHHLYAGPHGH